jgi:hypothetical protein
LAWETVVKEKDRGGLGVGTILAKNKALFFKWIWKLGSNDKASWVDFIKEKYRPQFINGVPQFSKKFSGIWRGIYSTIINKDHDSTLICADCKLKLGNGNHVNFWSDTWLTDFCLVNSYPSLFHLSFSKAEIFRYRKYWIKDTWFWNLKWIRPLITKENLLFQRLMSNLNLVVIHRSKEDKLVWEWGKEGGYTVLYTCP